MVSSSLLQLLELKFLNICAKVVSLNLKAIDVFLKMGIFDANSVLPVAKLNFTQSIGDSMVYSDISKLLYVISGAVRRVKLETILKYHDLYLSQISSTNHDFICLYY